MQGGRAPSFLKCQPYCQQGTVTLPLLPFQWYFTTWPPDILFTDIWITHSAFFCLILWLMLQKKMLKTMQQFGILCLVIILLICHMSLWIAESSILQKQLLASNRLTSTALCHGKKMYSKNIFYYWHGHKQEWASQNRKALWANN